ncbi:UNVERIFIED_ORG: NAD(P)-dependent dehydrogenase (short-subunit alcohol dehydrogenase family) [Rhizobium esperanzae]
MHLAHLRECDVDNFASARVMEKAELMREGLLRRWILKALNKQGSIVLMASMGGISGAGITVAYSTSKGGVVLMAKSLADALGPDGIRVNAVAPGTIDTELLRTSPGIAQASEGFRQRTPLRRLGKPSEVGMPSLSSDRTCRAMCQAPPFS